ncbi:hypothetical protein CR513_52833 [Mucuna pruriens]|uniref:Uncharacterized protein n=1 Tax=Mucuna pruriens TaxID=157652 RepID=A0A371EQ65_MUCPR|nr:hypothetical protein CR513_52833 [Mucuna pruriens]
MTLGYLPGESAESRDNDATKNSLGSLISLSGSSSFFPALFLLNSILLWPGKECHNAVHHLTPGHRSCMIQKNWRLTDESGRPGVDAQGQEHLRLFSMIQVTKEAQISACRLVGWVACLTQQAEQAIETCTGKTQSHHCSILFQA